MSAGYEEYSAATDDDAFDSGGPRPVDHTLAISRRVLRKDTVSEVEGFDGDPDGPATVGRPAAVVDSAVWQQAISDEEFTSAEQVQRRTAAVVGRTHFGTGSPEIARQRSATTAAASC